MVEPNTLLIDDLIGGELLRLQLHHNDKPADEIVTRFVGFKQESGYERAQLQEDDEVFIWNLRHVKNKWLYGTSEQEYATIAEILEGGNGYIHDKHLLKLKTRMSHRGIKM
jgi:hypothetical protein